MGRKSRRATLVRMKHFLIVPIYVPRLKTSPRDIISIDALVVLRLARWQFLSSVRRFCGPSSTVSTTGHFRHTGPNKKMLQWLITAWVNRGGYLTRAASLPGQTRRRCWLYECRKFGAVSVEECRR